MPNDKPFKEQYAQAMGKLGLNIYDHKGIDEQVKTLLKAEEQQAEQNKMDKNMAEGGEVVLGQAPTDPVPVEGQDPSQMGDVANRNLTPKEVVVSAPAAKVVGEIVQAVDKRINEMLQQGEDPTAFVNSLAAAVTEHLPQPEENLPQEEVMAEPDPNIVPPEAMTPQPATTGPVALPEGTGPMNPDPISA